VICGVCLKEASGFGYSPYTVGTRYWKTNYRKFCSMRCLNIYSTIQKRKGNSAMIDPTKHEIEAMHAAIPPLGEYVTEVGMYKPLNDYSKEQILTMIEVVVTAYHENLRTLVPKEFEEDSNVRF
tara:strand:- start:113 stop:484 length:372 start_codon:yes stop_codon:yes gene_type:complete